MTTAAQRHTAIEEAQAAMLRAVGELDTARKLLSEHFREVAATQTIIELDEMIEDAHRVRRAIARLR